MQGEKVGMISTDTLLAIVRTLCRIVESQFTSGGNGKVKQSMVVEFVRNLYDTVRTRNSKLPDWIEDIAESRFSEELVVFLIRQVCVSEFKSRPRFK